MYKSVKKWLFLWCCFVGVFFLMYDFVHLQCLQDLSLGLDIYRNTVSSCPEIPLGENARVQNPERNLVLRHCFEYLFSWYFNFMGKFVQVQYFCVKGQKLQPESGFQILTETTLKVNLTKQGRKRGVDPNNFCTTFQKYVWY